MKRIISLILLCLILSSSIFTVNAEENKAYKNKGDLIADIIGHAQSQIGYQTDENKSKYDISNEEKDNWSTSFLYWCANKAFISDESVPYFISADKLYEFYSEKTLTHNKENYTPVEGDIIFISDNDKISLCGIVTTSDETTVTAIIGDDNNAVKKKMYDRNLSKITGYATPDYIKKEIISISGYITTADSLNLRSQPSTESEILTKIPMGTIIELSEIENNWGKTVYNDISGYVSMDYVSEYDITHTDKDRYGVKWNVIDISKFQGNIDWSLLATEDIDAVIIRLGFRGTLTKVIHEDEEFLEFYNKAKESGFHIGCYFYSGSTTVAEANEEAKYIAEYIKTNDLKFDMPVYWDVEDNIIKATGKENICKMTEEFFSVMDYENIYSGVYTSSSWMTDFFNPALFSDHALWIADWRGYCGYAGDYGMWQYTETGTVAGITEKVDKNYCYINYPLLISDKNYNTIPEHNTSAIIGDINEDGKITASDARTVLRIAALLDKVNEDKKYIADYNSDNKITASDARLILRKSAKLE